MHDERMLGPGMGVAVLFCPDDHDRELVPVPCTVVEVRGYAARLQPVGGEVAWPGPGTPAILSYTFPGGMPVVAETMTTAPAGAAPGEMWAHLPALSERRSHPRRRANVRVALFPIGPEPGHVSPVVGRMDDVSIDGMRLLMPEPLPAGSRAFLSFRPSEARPIRALVEVVACAPTDDGGHVVRAAFRLISEDDRGRVAELILAAALTAPEAAAGEAPGDQPSRAVAG